MTTIKLSGRQEDIDTIVTMLRHIEYLGEVGASRNILVRVDGDGLGTMNTDSRSTMNITTLSKSMKALL